MFARRLAELSEEEGPLEKEVLGKQEKRRAVLKKRIAAARAKFIGAALPTAVFLVLAIVFGYLITTRNDGLFLYLTIACAALFAVSFVAFGVFTNRFVNARRINRANEDLSSTERGNGFCGCALIRSCTSILPNELPPPRRDRENGGPGAFRAPFSENPGDIGTSEKRPHTVRRASYAGI